MAACWLPQAMPETYDCPSLTSSCWLTARNRGGGRGAGGGGRSGEWKKSDTHRHEREAKREGKKLVLFPLHPLGPLTNQHKSFLTASHMLPRRHTHTHIHTKQLYPSFTRTPSPPVQGTVAYAYSRKQTACCDFHDNHAVKPRFRERS